MRGYNGYQDDLRVYQGDKFGGRTNRKMNQSLRIRFYKYSASYFIYSTYLFSIT